MVEIDKDKNTIKTDFDPLFLADVKALFLGKKEDNLSPYIYSTPNADIDEDLANGEVYYYELVSQNPDYYLYKEDIELINNAAAKIAAYVPPESSVIEFGPGTDIAFKNKSLPFLKEIKQLKSYIPIDLCETYLIQSKAILADELPEVAVETIKTDFIKNLALVSNYKKPVVFFKGSTITNLSSNGCLDFLSRIAQALKPNGRLIVGVDANQSESSLRKAYDNDIMAHLVLSTLHCINRDLPVSGFDPLGFKYEFNWVPENHCVAHTVRVTKEQNFVLDGISINIENGKKFHLLSSYKYPIDYFQNIALKAGLKSLDYFVHKNQRMVIHVFEAQ